MQQRDVDLATVVRRVDARQVADERPTTIGPVAAAMKSTTVSWPRSVLANPRVNRLEPASRNDAAQSSGENEKSRKAKPTKSRSEPRHQGDDERQRRGVGEDRVARLVGRRTPGDRPEHRQRGPAGRG